MKDPQTLLHRVEDAYEIYGWPGEGRLLICCEHASNRLPAPLAADPADQPWLETHWAYDIRSRDVVLELVEQTGAVAVLARFSRLVCDANRAPDDPCVIHGRVEHHTLGFNEILPPHEKARRIETFHRPYHDAVDAQLRRLGPGGGDTLLLSVHTFVPALYGLRRNLDVGVLFDPYEAVATRLAADIEAQGLVTALNEPYSGRRGLIYSAARHGLGNQVLYLELEINQALLTSSARTRRLARVLARCLERLQLRTRDRAGTTP